MTIKAEDILADSLFGDEEGIARGREGGLERGKKKNARGNQSQLPGDPVPVRSSLVSADSATGKTTLLFIRPSSAGRISSSPSSPAAAAIRIISTQIVLRKGLVHPDLSEFAEDGGKGAGSTRATRSIACSCRATSIPPAARRSRRPSGSGCTSRRTCAPSASARFTVGTELHRSGSLAIVQVLVLYHLVTARATVALGGEATRTDQPAAEGRAAASAAS
jgi:hypothetical protein